MATTATATAATNAAFAFATPTMDPSVMALTEQLTTAAAVMTATAPPALLLASETLLAMPSTSTHLHHFSPQVGVSSSWFKLQETAELQDQSERQQPQFLQTKKSLRHTLQVDEKHVAAVLDSSKRPRVVGHRGALYEALENTREAFQHCAAMGCDAVELDVFCLQDGTLIVFHGGGTDEEPGDLTDYCLDQDGVSILDLTFAECQELQFNTQFSEFPCPRESIQQGSIPTLEQVLLDLKDTTTQVKIELKGPGTVQPTLALVERLHMVHHCQFSSFDLSRLHELRQLRPQRDAVTGKFIYQTGALFDYPVPDDFLRQAQTIGASQVHLPYDTCTVERIQAIHQAGMGSMAWTRGPVGMLEHATDEYWDMGNEDESCYQAIIDTGVQEICCNRPDVLIALLKKQKF